MTSHEQLVVEFEGEKGVDAGALRSTFCELLIREVDQHLFEGDEKRHIPKKDWICQACLK